MYCRYYYQYIILYYTSYTIHYYASYAIHYYALYTMPFYTSYTMPFYALYTILYYAPYTLFCTLFLNTFSHQNTDILTKFHKLTNVTLTRIYQKVNYFTKIHCEKDFFLPCMYSYCALIKCTGRKLFPRFENVFLQRALRAWQNRSM